MKWYYAKNGAQHGPVTTEVLQSKIASGEVSATDLVWREGLGEWAPAGTIDELQGGSPAPVSAYPSSPSYSSPAAVPSSGAVMPGEPIPNYLWQSIVVTILCCWPLGIPAIVYAAKVEGLRSRGDIAGARAASNSAKMWTWIAFGSGLVAGLIYILFMVFFARDPHLSGGSSFPGR